MHDVDGRTHAHLVTFAEGQQRFEAGRFHPADHVRG